MPSQTLYSTSDRGSYVLLEGGRGMMAAPERRASGKGTESLRLGSTEGAQARRRGRIVVDVAFGLAEPPAGRHGDARPLSGCQTGI